ncbi:MAG: Asp-tRNA(Asn)/Glu-tRNA(Gln) amidotransferase subunit GatA [Acetobacter sp.]|nr:Asp-tRNA(Asn)/Glu-tRNA(Gln) amidotransferase subunit GatA [Acetobacter sp.]
MTLTKLTLSEARDGLLSRQFSVRELVQAYLDSIKSLNPALNAYITLCPPENILRTADIADTRYKSKENGLLEGLPIGIKDIFCTRGIRSTAASHMLSDFIPSYESTVTERLLKEGALFLGKTNMDEFAMGSSTTHSYFEPTINPWQSKDDLDKKFVAGGSSGGSAVAVSAELAIAAIGSDTGGSIRQPASYCGIVGLKPTYGRCSRFGMIAYASSLDQAGPMTRSVADAALMLEIMAGEDPRDSTCSTHSVPSFSKSCGKSVKDLRVGIPREYRNEGISSEVNTLWDKGIEWLKDEGCEIVDISLPHTRYGLPCYYIIAPAEASSNLARYDGIRFGFRQDAPSLDELYEKTRAEGFGAEVRRRILIGTYVLSAGYYDAYYLKAQKVRTLIRQDFEDAFKNVDVILTPTAPTAAFELGSHNDDPIQMYLNDIFTVPVSLAGVPALSVPAGFDQSGLPLGLQIIGRHFDEETVLSVGSVLEKAASFTYCPPPYVLCTGE